MRLMWALTAAVICLSGCGAAVTPGGVGPSTSPTKGDVGSSSIEGEWWLVSGYGSKGTVQIRERADATMIIEGAKIEGTAICNSYNGRVKIEGSSFRTRGFSVTEMGCLPASAGESQNAYLSALLEVRQIIRRGDHLTLKGPSAELKFKFHHQPPTPELASTRWKLNGLVVGRGSYGSVSSVDPGSLLLRSNGTLVGDSGCRRFRAQWVASGDRVDVSNFELIGACNGNARQDEHVRTVLSSGFTFEIREQSLQLYQLDGDLGLDYTTGLR